MFTQIAQISQHCIAMKVLWDFAIDIHVASFHTSRELSQVLLTSTFHEFCQKHFGASFSSTITLLHDEGCDMMYKLSCKRNSANKFSTLLEEGRLDEEGWLFAGELAYAIKRDGGSTLQQKRIPVGNLPWCVEGQFTSWILILNLLKGV